MRPLCKPGHVCATNANRPVSAHSLHAPPSTTHPPALPPNTHTHTHTCHAHTPCRYSQGELVEVNAHSLFSKWFSESGKLVSKLFAKITELVEEEDTLVFVLIDEVESLTSARKVCTWPGVAGITSLGCPDQCVTFGVCAECTEVLACSAVCAIQHGSPEPACCMHTDSTCLVHTMYSSFTESCGNIATQ